MADKMRTPKIKGEGVGSDSAKLRGCIRTLLGGFKLMTAQLVQYTDFCIELLDLADIEEEQGDMLEVKSHLECFDLLADRWSGYFEDVFTKFDDLLDIEKAERGTKIVDFLSRLGCLDLPTNFLNGYFADEDLDRIKLSSSLRGKKKTKA